MYQERKELILNYQTTRLFTERLCSNLLTEDYVIQGMSDVSPPKWHLGHTTWFFETFILNKYFSYTNPFSHFNYIFNSYYQGIGKPYPRNQRGLLARPSVEEIYEYRKNIDHTLINLLNNCSADIFRDIKSVFCLGIHHEQQHQELLLMDIKYNYSIDPSVPVYGRAKPQNKSFKKSPPNEFFEMEGGLSNIGYKGEDFCFDNELPRHQKYIHPFYFATTLIRNSEYLEFIEDGGYTNPNLWLADGWDWLQANQIQAPMYWQLQKTQWMCFTLYGLKPLDLAEPVSHISYYEAEAFARWKNCRLPTEEEWEYAANKLKFDYCNYNFKEQELIYLHPIFNESNDKLFFGDLWEWTSSAYLPFPGYKPGKISEYNGKFMNNQRVLRGASFITPRNHIRITYRNYYSPEKRWQFSGIRLAKDN